MFLDRVGSNRLHLIDVTKSVLLEDYWHLLKQPAGCTRSTPVVCASTMCVKVVLLKLKVNAEYAKCLFT